MAEFCGAGCCFSPILVHLEKTFLKDAEIQQKISESMKKRKVKSLNPVSAMYTGGTIRPVVGGGMSKVDAIGFHDGKVVALGSKHNVLAQMKLLGTEFNEINLPDGNTLLPGLIEPHVHIVPTALSMGWNDFGPFDGQDMRKGYDTKWLGEAIEKSKDSLNKGYWILGLGLDPSLMPFTIPMPSGLAKLQSFTIDELDQLEEVVPLFTMSASGHTAYINTPATKLIFYSNKHLQDKYTLDEFKDYVNSRGGLQELDEIKLAFPAMPKLQLLESAIEIPQHLYCIFETAVQRGITLMYDAAMTRSMKDLLKTYSLLVGTKVRIGYAQFCTTMKDAEDLHINEPMTEFENVYQGSVKLISDGSNQGLTGYQSEPYRCLPADNAGAFNYPLESGQLPPGSEFLCIVKTIAEKGWPLMIHANGDKSITLTLQAYKQTLDGESGLVKRHRIEHCSLIDECTLQHVSDLGISPSFLIGHVGYWGYVFRNAIFRAKAEQLLPCGSAVSKCMRITLHSDNSVSPLGPLRMMEQAITRIMEEDPDRNVLNENQKLTPEQALRAVTYDAAWQCHADQWVGSLEVGKMADFVILAEDPITRKDPVGMRNIPVLETWVRGVKVYPS